MQGIDIATGHALDQIGTTFGVPRRYDVATSIPETDVEYRERLLSYIRYPHQPLEYIEFTITLDKPKCVCDIKQLFSYGHNKDCVDHPKK